MVPHWEKHFTSLQKINLVEQKQKKVCPLLFTMTQFTIFLISNIHWWYALDLLHWQINNTIQSHSVKVENITNQTKLQKQGLNLILE